MAYRSFAAWPEVEALALYGAAHADEVPLFSALEYRVIGIGARTDVRRELNPDSFVARWLNRLFGIEFSRPLADQRLEALRRFASIVAHVSHDAVEDHVNEFLAAGYSRRQAEWLTRMPARARTPLRAALA
jgi:hypothetical protein